MHKCWVHAHEGRITFKSLIEELTNMQSQLKQQN